MASMTLGSTSGLRAPAARLRSTVRTAAVAVKVGDQVREPRSRLAGSARLREAHRSAVHSCSCLFSASLCGRPFRGPRLQTLLSKTRCVTHRAQRVFGASREAVGVPPTEALGGTLTSANVPTPLS